MDNIMYSKQQNKLNKFSSSFFPLNKDLTDILTKYSICALNFVSAFTQAHLGVKHRFNCISLYDHIKHNETAIALLV